MRELKSFWALNLLTAAAAAQPLAFEAASVKAVSIPAAPAGRAMAMPKQPGARRVVEKPIGGPGTSDPGRIHYPFVTMEFLLEKAYDAVNFRIAGPAWLNSERFDVDATMPPSTTKAQFQIMLQNLLAERFKLAMHRETRELPGYSLVVAKNGPKFKESAGELAAQDENAPDPPLRLGLDGYFVPPQRPGIFLQMSRPPGAHSTFRQVTMQMLASSLQSQLRRPVGNATGLTAKYDFVLNFSTEGLDLGSGRIPVSPGDADPPPDIFSALPSQLGLILESKKGPAEVIVIDHVEKAPIEN